MYTGWAAALEGRGLVGTVKLKVGAGQAKCALTAQQARRRLHIRSSPRLASPSPRLAPDAASPPRQARHAFIDAQDCQELALGNPSTAFPVLVEALARCGDAKFGGVVEMTFASRIRAVVQAVLGDATVEEMVAEAVAAAERPAAAANGGADPDLSEEQYKACWRKMAFKDLYGFPLWETDVHDLLRDAFAELRLIFVHYCGASAQGSESIGAATKIGLLEFLSFAKDVRPPEPSTHTARPPARPACVPGG